MRIDFGSTYMIMSNPNVIMIKTMPNSACYEITTDIPNDIGHILSNEAESFCNQVVAHGFFVARYVESPFILVLVKE